MTRLLEKCSTPRFFSAFDAFLISRLVEVIFHGLIGSLISRPQLPWISRCFARVFSNRGFITRMMSSWAGLGRPWMFKPLNFWQHGAPVVYVQTIRVMSSNPTDSSIKVNMCDVRAAPNATI
jgi:hypothetical protein